MNVGLDLGLDGNGMAGNEWDTNGTDNWTSQNWMGMGMSIV
jgi:hypothetical protein